MKTGNLALIVILALVLVLGGCGCSSYNNLIRGDQGVKQSWSNVETNYQRRTDLYNSVVKTIQGSANFEKSTLNDVISARARATSIQVNLDNPQSLQQYQQAQNQFQGAFGRLLAVAEAYPDFNKTVQGYNLQVRTFPNNLFAGVFGFHEKGYFQANPGSENPPDINFNTK